MMRVADFLQLCGVEPDRYGLLRWLANEVTDEDIVDIATADAGFDASDNEKALRRLLAAGEVREPFDAGKSWLQECCEMTMWRAKNDHGGGRELLLACTILILARLPGAPLEDRVMALSDPVAALVCCVPSLSEPVRSLCLGMLADAGVSTEPELEQEDWDEPDHLFCAAGILAIVDEPSTAAVGALLQLEEQAAGRCLESGSREWLWRSSSFDQSRALWKQHLLGVAERTSNDKLAARVGAWRSKES